MADTGGRLTERSYWEDDNSKTGKTSNGSAESKVDRWVRNPTGPNTIANHLFWDVLLPRYVQKPRGASVVEVGSAPGRNLVSFHRRFGYSPYGIEYTSSGAEANRELFRRLGLDPEAVIQADLFDEDRLRDYRGRFDIVFSGGLIEHFEDPRAAVQRHVDLLAPSGILIISIPNLQGLNWLLCRVSCPDVLAIHNLSIMNRTRWLALFEGMGLTQVYSGYCGVIDLGLMDFGSARLSDRFFRAANKGLRYLPKFLQVETRMASPRLVYIGRKGLEPLIEKNNDEADVAKRS
jgi:SAM-dependent methyltransferase